MKNHELEPSIDSLGFGLAALSCLVISVFSFGAALGDIYAMATSTVAMICSWMGGVCLWQAIRRANDGVAPSPKPAPVHAATMSSKPMGRKSKVALSSVAALIIATTSFAVFSLVISPPQITIAPEDVVVHENYVSAKQGIFKIDRTFPQEADQRLLMRLKQGKNDAETLHLRCNRTKKIRAQYDSCRLI